MEKLKQIRKLRKGWKIFIAAMLALIVFGGVGMYGCSQLQCQDNDECQWAYGL